MGLIRLLLAISVVLAHTSALPFVGYLAGGLVAVQSFFILSGFYMALILHEKYNNSLRFYWNRLSRLYSGYWIVLAVAVCAGPLLNLTGLGEGLYENEFRAILTADWSLSAKLMMLFANVFMVGSDVMMFTHPDNGVHFTSNFMAEGDKFYLYHYIPQVWSIPVEMCFYAIAPFVVKSWKKIALLFAVSIAIRLLTYRLFGPHDPWTYRFFPNELALFMAGAFSYQIYRLIKNWPIKKIGFFLLALVVTLMPLAYSKPLIFYVILTLSIPFIFSTVHHRVDNLAGEISYLVYLCHWLFVSFGPIVAVLSSIALACLLHLLAGPLDRYFRGLYDGARALVIELRSTLGRSAT